MVYMSRTNQGNGENMVLFVMSLGHRLTIHFRNDSLAKGTRCRSDALLFLGTSADYTFQK